MTDHRPARAADGTALSLRLPARSWLPVRP